MVRGGLLKVRVVLYQVLDRLVTYTVYHKEPLSVAAHTSSRRRWPAARATGPAAPLVLGVAVLVDPTGRYLARACVLPASQRSVPTQCRSCSSLARTHVHRNSSFLSRKSRLCTARTSGSADRDASAHAGYTSARASVPNIRCIKLIDPPTAPAATAYANAATVLGKQNTGHRGLGKQNSDWRRPRMRPTGAECNQDQAAKLGAMPLWR